LKPPPELLPGSGLSGNPAMSYEQSAVLMGMTMADHGAPKYSTAPGNDYAQHERTYEDFLTLTKWVTILVVAVLVLMFIFLT
jgi:hypothetical protein